MSTSSPNASPFIEEPDTLQEAADVNVYSDTDTNTSPTSATSATSNASAGWFGFKIPTIQNPFLTVSKSDGAGGAAAEIHVESDEGDEESIALVQRAAPMSYSATPQAPGASGRSTGPSSPDRNLSAREKGLLAREAHLKKEEELRRREAELMERERQLLQQAAIANQPRVPNFPWIWPLMFHNIELDIPDKAKNIQLWMYRSFLLLGALLIVNAIACFAVMISHPTGMTTTAKDFGVSVVYGFGIMTSSFFLWYRPVYNAFMKESSMLFYFYFLFGGLHVLYYCYMALGIPGSGSAGFIMALSVITARNLPPPNQALNFSATPLSRSQPTSPPTPPTPSSIPPLLTSLSYPLLLTPNQPPRRGYFQKPYPDWWPWYERLFLASFRMSFARAAGTAFLNNRFGAGYVPLQLVQGAKLAASSVVDGVSGWDGSVESAEERGLDRILTPSLYQNFAKAHQELDRRGVYLELEIDVGALWGVKDIYISFGSKGLVDSTLLPGKIIDRIHTTTFTQLVPKLDSKPPRRILRELTFEYISPASNYVERDDIESKRELMVEGQRVAATIEFPDAEITSRFYAKSIDITSFTSKKGELIMEESVRRPFRMRLESSHFQERFPEDGEWRVADVDDLLVEQRILQEEMEDLDEDDD
ncbi:hypothetical protein HDV05_000882 [Chytridiales sp. JEL 0842]|nr:hypothetical protein HDV05_000882 [Chytridiales sp. JEL 0842]